MGVTAPRGSACILPVHFIQFQEKPNYFLQPAPCSCISLFYMHTSTGFSITGTQGQGEGNRFVLTWENGPEPVVSWASGKAQCTRGVLLLKKWDLIQKFAKECKILDLPQSICMPFLQQVTERCWFRQFIWMRPQRCFFLCCCCLVDVRGSSRVTGVGFRHQVQLG